MAHGSLSQFKAALARKKARKEKAEGKFDRKKLGFTESVGKPEYNFPKLQKSELEQLKLKIRQRAKAERRVEFVIYGVVILGIVGLLFYLN